jgi:hypothetical protein
MPGMSLSVWICLNCFASRSAALDWPADEPVLRGDAMLAAVLSRQIVAPVELRTKGCLVVELVVVSRLVGSFASPNRKLRLPQTAGSLLKSVRKNPFLWMGFRTITIRQIVRIHVS